MVPADVPAVMTVQAACYGEHLLEPASVLHDRLQAAADTCWVALRGDRVCAYLAAYRSRLGSVTALNGPFKPAPSPDTLYLHDLAVHPELHGSGLGGRLVDGVMALARREGLRWSALVAVQGATSFWQRQGYAPHAPAQPDRLGPYGDDAHYMVRALSA
jgi:predicted N-acetyltransferase YhbS